MIIVGEWFIFITKSFNDNFEVTLKNNGWKTKVLQNLKARTAAMDSTLATEWGKSFLFHRRQNQALRISNNHPNPCFTTP